MHEGAEYGIAAHWRYKEGGRKEDKSFERRIEWLRSMMDWRQEVTDGQEFVDALKSDLFPDRVYAFTPRGDIIDLPAGVTPVDFAYHIHTSVGERCRGAKVNGRLVSLNHALESGDQVEILTSKRGGPSRDWLNADLGYVRSARAREKIRSWFKKQAREENISTGRSIIDREVKRLNIRGLSREATAKMFGHAKVEDFLAAVGCGDVHEQTVINQMVAWLRSQSKEDAETLPPPDTKPARQIQADEVNVYGTRGLLTHLGRCCNPVPGDEIVGYTTRGRGVTIHRKDCPNVLRVREAERFISVAWGAKPAKIYPVSVHIVAFDREGLMRDISTIVADEHVNMSAISMLPGQGHEVDVNVTLEVSHLTQLGKVLSRLEQLTNVTQVRRLQPG
jgi:GTP pyrophosphokinase